MMAVLSVALAMIRPWNGGDGDVLEDRRRRACARGDLDLDILPEDAVRYHSIYGVCGISVFAVRDASIDELAQQAPLVASIA